MAKFTKTLSGDSRYSIELEVKETSTNISENTSVVSYTLKATKSSGSGYYTSNKTNPVKVSLDGSEIVNKKIAYDFTGSTPKTITLASGTKTIQHNADGTKTIACSGYFKDAENSLGSATASGNLTLTQLHKAPDVDITGIIENVSYLKTTIGLSDATFVSNVSIKTLTLIGTTYDDASITSFKVKNGNYSETTTNITNNTGSITLNFQNNPITISPPAEGMVGNNRILLEITATDNKNASKTTTFSYSIPVVNNLQYLQPTITPTSVSAKRDGQLTGKVKLNASGTYTDKIGYASGYTTLTPTLVLQVYEHNSSTLKFSRNITTSDSEFSVTSNTWTLTDLQIGSTNEQDNNWFDPTLMYDLKLTIKDDVTTNVPLTPLETTSNVLIGEATWTEYKDRVDFKKLTINKQEILAPYTLYDGNESRTDKDITLSDSASNYKMLEIFYNYYNIDDAKYKSTRVYEPNGKIALIDGSYANATYLYFESARYTISGTNLTRTSAYRWRFRTDGNATRTDTTTNDPSIWITRVVGYK